MDSQGKCYFQKKSKFLFAFLGDSHSVIPMIPVHFVIDFRYGIAGLVSLGPSPLLWKAPHNIVNHFPSSSHALKYSTIVLSTRPIHSSATPFFKATVRKFFSEATSRMTAGIGPEDAVVVAGEVNDVSTVTIYNFEIRRHLGIFTIIK